MDLTEQIESMRGSGAPWGSVPPRMRVLYIASYQRIGGWLTDGVASESGSEVLLEEAVSPAAAMARLRDEVFDVVIVGHQAGEIDGVELSEAIRAGGTEDPVIVLGEPPDQEMVALLYEAGADAYLCVNATNTRTLVCAVSRAIERSMLIRENRRLVEADRQRLEQEHVEADRLLAQQRTLIGDLEAVIEGPASKSIDPQPTTEELAESQPLRTAIPQSLTEHYGELLRAYVVMGAGNLSDEMSALAELLVTTGVTAHETMAMHIGVLETLVRGRGSRSARHVINRGELLVLEIMIHLAEGYRQQSVRHDSKSTPRPNHGIGEGPILGIDLRKDPSA